jgi:hypothetical protein
MVGLLRFNQIMLSEAVKRCAARWSDGEAPAARGDVPGVMALALFADEHYEEVAAQLAWLPFPPRIRASEITGAVRVSVSARRVSVGASSSTCTSNFICMGSLARYTAQGSVCAGDCGAAG